MLSESSEDLALCQQHTLTKAYLLDLEKANRFTVNVALICS